MEKILMIRNQKLQLNFDLYHDINKLNLLFKEVMCYRDKTSGEIYPIEFEEQRIKLIIDALEMRGNSSTISSGTPIKSISPVMRYDLSWLQNNKPQISSPNNKISKGDPNTRSTSIVKEKQVAKNLRNKLKAKKKKNKKNYEPPQDAMSYRVAGSFGTGKRR